MDNKAMEYMKRQNDISVDVDRLENLSSFLESESYLNEIHSIAWTIQLKAERMLKFLSEQRIMKLEEIIKKHVNSEVENDV